MSSPLCKKTYTNKVIILKGQDFDLESGRLVNYKLKKGITTVMVFVDWCGHCQIAKPIFGNISKMTYCQVNCAAIDGEKNKDLVNKLSSSEASKDGLVVQGYPTFLQFQDGEFHRSYDAPSSDSKRLMNFVLGVENY